MIVDLKKKVEKKENILFDSTLTLSFANNLYISFFYYYYCLSLTVNRPQKQLPKFMLSLCYAICSICDIYWRFIETLELEFLLP